jgi:hypothetical protein
MSSVRFKIGDTVLPASSFCTGRHKGGSKGISGVLLEWRRRLSRNRSLLRNGSNTPGREHCRGHVPHGCCVVVSGCYRLTKDLSGARCQPTFGTLPSPETRLESSRHSRSPRSLTAEEVVNVCAAAVLSISWRARPNSPTIQLRRPSLYQLVPAATCDRFPGSCFAQNLVNNEIIVSVETMWAIPRKGERCV